MVIDDHPLDDIAVILPRNYEKQIINEKYDYIEEVIKECLFNKDEKAATTDKVDRLMTILYGEFLCSWGSWLWYFS